MKVYQQISKSLQWIESIDRSDTIKAEWRDKADDQLEAAMDRSPSGSGIDSGTTLDRDQSTSNKLVFTFGYHHMNDGGYYDGWTDHTLIVTPTLCAPGYSLSISGRNRNEIKDYLHECFDVWLASDYVESVETSDTPTQGS